MAEYEKLQRQIKKSAVNSKSMAVQKNSEARLKVKKTEDKDEKRQMTGLDPLSGKAQMHEVLRLESSYGNITFGASDKRELSVLVSEKRRHNAPTLDDGKKRLRQSREKERPLGRGTVAAHDFEGVTEFRYHADTQKNEVLAGIKKYLAKDNVSSVNRMLPFATAGTGGTRELDTKKSTLENELELRLREAVDRINEKPVKKKSDIDFRALLSTLHTATRDAGLDDEAAPEDADDTEIADNAEPEDEKPV